MIKLKGIGIPEVEIHKIDEYECKQLSRNREDEVIKQLRIDYLNKEEKKSLINICVEYYDLFYLPGDKLTATDTLEHTIPLKQDTAPINIKPYRIPEQHKEEV